MKSSKFCISVFIFFASFTSLLACSEVPQQKPEIAQPPLPANVVNYIQKEPLKPEYPRAAAPAEIKSDSPKNETKKITKIKTPVEKKGANNTSTSNESLKATFPVYITDIDGRAIIFDSPPKRIIAFDSAAVETLFAIGEGHRIIGTHDYVSYPPDANSITKVGDAFNMDVEAVVGLNPDLVYLFYPSFKEQLENAGLKVLLISTMGDDISEMADHFRMWGHITGAVMEANNLADDFEGRILNIESTLAPYTEGPSVFQDVGGLWTPGKNTLVGNVFKLLKLQNIAHDIEGYQQISPEVIVERNPQYIISSYSDIFSDDPKYSGVVAVKNGSIYIPSADYLSISGPRFLMGVDELANFIYPGIFK